MMASWCKACGSKVLDTQEEVERGTCWRCNRDVAAKNPRRCYFIDEAMTDERGHYRPAIVTENEPGYHRTDYDYGTDFYRAHEAVETCNRQLGLTTSDCDEIVLSSFRRSA